MMLRRIYRALSSLFIVTLLLMYGCAQPADAIEANADRDTAPDFQLTALSGETVTLSTLRGQIVVVNFWATWCGPCREEMPYLEEIHRNANGNGVVVLAVNVGEPAAEVEAFVREFDLTMPVLLDTDYRVSRLYNVSAFPTTFLVDRDGIIQGRKIGAFPDAESIRDGINKIVK